MSCKQFVDLLNKRTALIFFLVVNSMVVQAVTPQVQDGFNDGEISPWNLIDNLGASGTFAANEANGELSMTAAGGGSSMASAGYSRILPTSSNFSVSVVITSTFNGNEGNKRGFIRLINAAGTAGYSVMSGKDNSSSWAGVVCRSNLGCTSPTGSPYVDGTRITYTIMKLDNTIKIFMNGALILSEVSQLSDLSQVVLYTQTGFNADSYTISFDDLDIQAGQ